MGMVFGRVFQKHYFFRYLNAYETVILLVK